MMVMMMDFMVSWVSMSMMGMVGMVSMVWSDELEECLQRNMSIMSMMVENLGEVHLFGQMLNIVKGGASLVACQLLSMR